MRRLVSTSGTLIQSLVLAALLVLPQAGSASDRNISSERNSQSTSNVISIEAAESRKAVTHSTSDTADTPFRQQRVSASAEELTAASARAGTCEVTALGGGDALYESGLDCPSGTIFGQPVHGPNDNWTAFTSDAAQPYLVYENFSGLESEICDVHWWGINAFNDGYEWLPCEKTVDTFEIKFYGDAGGSPGAEVCAYTVTPLKADTGLYYSGMFPLYEYHIDLEECCSLPSGWVSIQGTGDPYCWFLWMSSGTGDSFCYQWDGYDLLPWESDMSLCLTGGICPPGAAEENELCGQDTNGGCNMTNPHFEPISCGNTVCGTVWAQADPLGGGGERDTDWYTIDVPEMGGGCAELIFTVESLFPSAVFILEDECSPIEILAEGYGDDEQPAVVSAVVSTPGTYLLFVAPGTEAGPIFSGIACDSEQNDYAASVECIPSCTVECPPGSANESELCGDDDNGGCNMDEPNFEPISCGDTVCGTAWAEDGTRDTDWYEVVITEPSVLTWEAEAEFPVLIFIIDSVSGDCSDYMLLDSATADECELVSLTSGCLSAGTYWLWVGPSSFSGLPCDGVNNDYVATLTCDTCCILECPPDANQEAEPCGDDTNGGCNMDEPNFEPISCGDTICGTAWYDGSTRDTDWYEIVTEEPIVLTWDVTAEFDVAIGLVETIVPGSGDCCDTTGYLSPYDTAIACETAIITTSCLPPGTYWLFVAPDFYAQSFDCDSDSKDYIATLTCEPCPTGACCLLDGTCVPDRIDYECVAIGGLWQGPDTTCEPNPCPQPEPGDNCIIPLELTIGPNDSPYTDINYTCGRYDYYGDTCLGYYDSGEDIIYKLTVTGAMDVDIILDPCGTSWTGIAISDMCPLEQCIGYSTSGSSSEPHGIECVHLDQGVYYIMIDTWPSPDCIEQFVLTISQCVPDISVEPNQLNFDCYGGYGGENTSDDTSGMQTGTKAYIKHNHSGSGTRADLAGNSVSSMEQQERSPAEKLIDADQIMEAFESGRDNVDVIVNLVKPLNILATISSGDVDSRRALQRDVAKRQDAVLSALKDDEFGLRYRYDNLAAFSGAVTRKGLEKLMNNPGVASIEPVRILHAHLAQGIPLMNALDYRSTYNGQGMAIAICDTGIDYNHPMLGDGGFPNGKVIGGYDFGDDDGDPFPCNAHGTACAGLAAGDLGSVGDYIGGVAHNAKLYALKISYGCSGSAYTDAMIAAWDWCVTNQYDDPCNPIMVISTSFGGDRFFSESSCDDANSAMTNAAENAVAAGITVLASAGNDGWCESMGWPACISSVISVGAVYDAGFGTYQPCVDEDSCATKYASGSCPSGWYAIDNTAADMVTSYSNSATFLDQLAPSNRAYTTDIAGSEGYSSGDYTSSFGGTSAASPYAAGAVACLQQAAQAITGSYLTPQQVRSTLAATGDPIADDKIPSIIKPRVNLGNAIDSLSPCPGRTLTIYNDGGGTLEVTSIDRPAWVDLSPPPPYSIAAGNNQEVCVVVDCYECDGYDLARLLTIHSNDPDENPWPDGVYIRVDCPSCGPAGDLDNDCDEDMLDYSIFAMHWQETGCDIADWCDGADLTQNGQVDMYDLAEFVEEWLWGTGL